MRAPVLAVGDGALGFWKALRDVFSETREQRCRVHEAANVLDALPKSAQPAAKAALAEIWGAEDIDHARTALAAFAKAYGAKFPKAVAKLADDQQELLAFYQYPAEHWIHLRTTNPIESTFSAVRLRTKVTRGAGSRAAALAMTFKLIESPPRNAGAPLTHPTWSPSCAPEPGSTRGACSSNGNRWSRHDRARATSAAVPRRRWAAPAVRCWPAVRAVRRRRVDLASGPARPTDGASPGGVALRTGVGHNLGTGGERCDSATDRAATTSGRELAGAL